MKNNLNPKRIAIFRTDRIGEVLLSTVAIEILKKRYPDAEISFFTSAYAAGVVSSHADLAEIVTVNISSRPIYSLDVYKLGGRLRKGKFDMAFVLNSQKIIHLACFLAGIPKRYGYDQKWGFLLTHRIMDYRNEAKIHEVDYTKSFFHQLGFDPGDAQPRLDVEDGMAELIRAELVDRSVDFTQPLIVLHPCASNELKFWSARKYIALLAKLKEISAKVIVIGESKEYDLIADIISDSGCRAINAAGMFNLDELAGLLKLSSLFIGNDSGPMHMAALLGKPVISIFSKLESGSNPVRWRPWGEHHAIFHELRQKELPCQLDHFTGYYLAKEDVSPDEVFQMLQTFLDERI